MNSLTVGIVALVGTLLILQQCNAKQFDEKDIIYRNST